MRTTCSGCDGNSKYSDERKKEDHVHQYVNLLGTAKTCWFVDGKAFFDSTTATDHIVDTLACARSEAMKYLLGLHKFYN